MVIPKVKNIYLYEGEKYIVRYCAIFDPILVVQTYNSNQNSEFKEFNYWVFMFKAKHIGAEKISEAY